MPLILLDRCRDRWGAPVVEVALRDDSWRVPWSDEGGRRRGGEDGGRDRGERREAGQPDPPPSRGAP